MTGADEGSAPEIMPPHDPAVWRQVLSQTLATHEAALKARRRKNSWLLQNLQLFSFRASANWLRIQDRGLTPPEDMLVPYPISGDSFEAAKTPFKYRIRPYNLSRDLLRLHEILPELLDPDTPRREVLELSPGACAMHELLAPRGHRLRLAEFQIAPDGPYGPIHAALGVKPEFFDGSRWPYPLPDLCADHVICFQAFDFYTKEIADYPAILAELQRLTRISLAVVFNSHRKGEPERVTALQALLGPDPRIRWTHCPDSTLAALVWTRG